MLGYEIYDIYLEYKDEPITGDPYSDRQERNLINELYQAGDFGSFIQRHTISVSLSDCKNQDFTDFTEMNPEIAAYLEECAEEYGTKVILISYRDEAAYQNGYKHTYNDKMQSKGILQYIRKLSNLDIVFRGLFLEEVFLKYCIRPPMVVLCLV